MRALWDEYIARNGNIVVAVKSVEREDLDHISDARDGSAARCLAKFSGMTASQIRNYTHENCSEYTETDKARIPISYRQIFDALGEEDALEIAEGISELVKLEGVLEDDE